MNQECKTTELEAQPIVGIRTTVVMSEIGKAMGTLFGEVHGYIQQNGGTPAGMPVAIYHSAPSATVDVECAIPVAAAMTGAGRVRSGELPAGKAATVTHVGPYDDLPQAWSALTEWIESQGLEAAAAPWEVYVTDPGAEPDQSKWRTDIFFPVR
ncbi:MAG: GyrI-like domain-containing protein [Acidobacteria bacterium]|nr:GyrI-like domain-containing protein [Acidobacteriota bacterium]